MAVRTLKKSQREHKAMTIETETAIHPFEKAGLGKAPFRYVGAVDQNPRGDGTIVIGEHMGVKIETKAGGTCDYCGMAIINMYKVRSADGHTFRVGCDCLKKVDIINPSTLKADVKKAKDAKADQRIASAKAMLATESVRAALASKPHPALWAQSKGLTMLDQVEWLLAHAGRSGKTDAAKIIERSII